MKDPFANLVFRGTRYTDGLMPVEALPELAAYRELVLALAKGVFQAAHPERQRLPKGFEAGFRLVLEKVESGSAVPNIARLLPVPTALPGFELDGPDPFATARDKLQEAIEAVTAGRDLPSEVTPDILFRFNAFGRTLRDDESMIVAQPGQRIGALYNREVRRALVLRAQLTYEDNVDLVGEVRGADKDTEGFALRTADGMKVDVRVPPLFMPLALTSLTGTAPVRVRGNGLFSADGTLQRVLIATDVSPAEEADSPTFRSCSTSVDVQVRSLLDLGAGWFDEQSPAFQAEPMGWLANVLRGLVDSFHLPTPYIYPTPEGGARAEWSTRGWEVAATVDLTSKTVEAFAARVGSEEVHELPLVLTQPGAEPKLGRFVADHL